MMAYKKRIRRRFILLWLGCLVIWLPAQNHQPPVNLPLITRAEILENARRAAEHRWLCREENTRASCAQSAPYSCDFAAGDSITGIAYDWGGMDDDVEFERKLRRGQAAGSHSRHGVTGCTTGMDCSGFVSYCWGQIQKYGTANIRQIAGKPRYNWFTDMKPGDVFNKPGSHIVLFVEYDPAGQPVVYEARGGRGKVVRNTRSWKELEGYIPLQYLGVVEED